MLPITYLALVASFTAIVQASPAPKVAGATLNARAPGFWDDWLWDKIWHQRHDGDCNAGDDGCEPSNGGDEPSRSTEPSKPSPTPASSSKPEPSKPTSSSKPPPPPSAITTPSTGTEPTSKPTTGNRDTVWKPAVGTQWQIILRNPVDASVILTPDVGVWDIDVNEHPDQLVQKLHAQGKKVICYFSAGSYEDWRTDKDRFQPSDLGKVLDGWPNERWLKTSSANVRNIMRDRIATAANKGCDAIDPDNVDGFSNDNGVGLTKADAVDYIKFLSAEAAKHGMSIGLKNAADIIDDVLDVVDFSVNEQCAQYSECTTFAKFIQAGKPVFHIEYPNEGATRRAKKRDLTPAAKKTCKQMQVAPLKGFSTVIKNMDLGGWVQYCDGKTFETVTLLG